VGDTVPRGDAERDCDPVPLRLPVEETLAHRVELRDIVGEPDALGQLDVLGEALTDPDAEEEGDTVAERHSEGLPVVDTVPRGDAERDCDPVPLRLPVTETLAHRVVLLVKVGLPLAEREARDGVPQGVAAGDADAPLRLPHSVGLPLGVALGEGLKEALPLALSEALALGEALLLAEGEPDSAPEKDGEGVADADPHALPLKVAVRAGEGLAAAVEEGVALTLRLRVEQPLEEGLTVPLRVRVPQALVEGDTVGESLARALRLADTAELFDRAGERLAEGETLELPEALAHALAPAEMLTLALALEVADELPVEICRRRRGACAVAGGAAHAAQNKRTRTRSIAKQNAG